jgi:hypothetical protein
VLRSPTLVVLWLAALSSAIPSPAMEPEQSVDHESLADTPSDGQVDRRTRLLIAGYAAATLAYGYNAWWENLDTSFEFRDEGWFGKDSYRGGADKTGHAYFGYASTRLLTWTFQWAGNDPARSRRLGAGLTGALLLAVEVFDGFTEEYGFGTGDLLMNGVGIGLGWLLESHPAWDDLLDFRLQYWPSDRKEREEDGTSIAEDYSGQTYLLLLKASGVPALRDHKILRYLEVAMGYGSRGYRPERPPDERERNVYYGISLNLSRLLDDTLFRGNTRETRTQRITHGTLELYQVPGTAALGRHEL